MFSSLNQIVRNIRSASDRNHATAKGKLASAVRATAVPSNFESLESRQLCTASTLAISVQQADAGPALLITGTSKSDRISISQSARGVTVTDSTGSTLIKNKVNVIEVFGGRGNDRISVANSVKLNTIIDAGAGNDVVRGGYGRDTIFGGAGNDRIYGNANNDVLAGMTGNDSLYGNGGKDWLIGGAGDDALVAVGGGSMDSLQGDSGFDSFWMDDSNGETVLDTLSADEKYNMAVHRVDVFMSYTDENAFDETISNELVGQDLTDPGQEWDEKSGSYLAEGYANFYDMPLFSSAGPSMDDLNQGAVGTCYFLSTLATVANTNAQWIQQSIVDFGDGTFGVRFIDNSGYQQYVRVDADLAVNTTDGGGLTLAYAGFGQGGSIWAPLMEKAWTFARDRNNSDSPIAQTSYHNIAGGWLDEAFTALGGADIYASDPNYNSFNDGEYLLAWIAGELENGKALTYATSAQPVDYIISSHAYTVVGVVQADDGQWYLELRNPWGVDGNSSTDGTDDGYVFLSASEAFNSMVQVASATV